jgi:hypothetical protein
MNKLIIGHSCGIYGKYKERLNIYGNHSFEKFLIALEDNDAKRSCGGMMMSDSCGKIAKTLRCFEVAFEDNYINTFIINDLSLINDELFAGKETNINVFLWITRGMLEELAETIDENIRYSGFIDNDFLCDVRDFLLNAHMKIGGYALSENG